MINDNIYNHLEQACQYLSRLKLDDCLKEIETYLTEIEHKQKAYTIGIRAAQISEDSIKLLSLIERGLLKIQGDRILFLETSYKACKQMGLDKKCIELAENLKAIGTTSNRIDLLLYEADALLINNHTRYAELILSKLIKQFPSSLESRLKAIDCKRQNKDWDGARRLARKTNKLFPNYWLSYDNFAEECLRAGKTKKARKLYSMAIKDDQNTTAKNEKPTVSLATLQYYSHNTKQTQSEEDFTKIKLVNRKIQLQWDASLQKDGDYQLVNITQASAIIDQHIGHRQVDLFQKCALPAMQADVIRVVHLATQPHALYIDWPYRPFQLSTLLSQKLFQSADSMLAGKRRNQDWRLWNGFAYSNPKNSLKLFFTEIMENIFYNIEHQISNNVYQVTGPASWQKVYDKYRVNLKSENIQCQCVTYPTDIYQVFRPALNKRPSMRGHWSKVQEKQSIYNNNSKNQ